MARNAFDGQQTKVTEFDQKSNGSGQTSSWKFDDTDNRSDEMQGAMQQWINTLVEQIHEARGSEQFQNWLDAQSAFHTYSARNALLIRCQRPNATKVAGYHTWQNEFDRYVKKGESAIWIWRPIIAPKCPECGNCESYHENSSCEYDEISPSEWDEGVVSFSPASVFDVSQTDGEPLPSLPIAAKGNGRDLRDTLLDAQESLSISVDVVPDREWTYGTANGCCSHDTGKPSVRVRERETDAALAGTLIHEYAHAVLHDAATDRTQAEIEAEATAYIVGQHCDLNMERSHFYLASWAGDKPEQIRDRLDQISTAARRIIKTLYS